MNYYNENDPKCVAWLRELIKAGLIPDGKIDDRSITAVDPADLDGFTQCHFFAGIGGWAYALRLAGWPDSRPVWTASCPCQPFSCAGKMLAEEDERHLWPTFYRLARERKPAIIFGEQVASAAALLWLDGVFADLEAANYTCGASDLCAAGIGAPHIRQRLYWLALATGEQVGRAGFARELSDGRMGKPDQAGWNSRESSGSPHRHRCSTEPAGDTCGLAQPGQQPEGRRLREPASRPASDAGRASDQSGRSGGACGLGESFQPRLEGLRGDVENGHEPGRLGAESDGSVAAPSAACHSAWAKFDLIDCADWKTRRIESGTFPLAHGIPCRVGLLRGYGNAIVPELAAEFIQAYLEIE